MKPWENVVSDMKLRASYGVNGNLPTGYYGYHGTYTIVKSLVVTDPRDKACIEETFGIASAEQAAHVEQAVHGGRTIVESLGGPAAKGKYWMKIPCRS